MSEPWTVVPSGDDFLPWRIQRRGDIYTSVLHAPECADVNTHERATAIAETANSGVSLERAISLHTSR